MEPYHHVRFRWERAADLSRLKTMLSGSYSVVASMRRREGVELAFKESMRRELKVEADTLRVTLESFRAIMFQREAAPFTARDLALRNAVVELYDRLGPFNSDPIPEPSFELEK
jgi:hypothetical protein